MSTSRRFLSVILGKRRFGIEVGCVQEIVRLLPITPVPRSGPAEAGLINLRGQVVSVLDLRIRLGFAPGPEPVVVILSTDDGLRGVLADEVGDVLEAREEQYEAPAETLSGPARELIRGAYKLRDGLLVALDVARLAGVA